MKDLLKWDKLNSISKLELVQLANLSVITIPILAVIIENSAYADRFNLDISGTTMVVLYISGLFIFTAKIIIGILCPNEIAKSDTKENFYDAAIRIHSFQDSLATDDKDKEIRQLMEGAIGTLEGNDNLSDGIEEKWNRANEESPFFRCLASFFLYSGGLGIMLYYLVIQPLKVFCN